MKKTNKLINQKYAIILRGISVSLTLISLLTFLKRTNIFLKKIINTKFSPKSNQIIHIYSKLIIYSLRVIKK
jgi:hypothetical protein